VDPDYQPVFFYVKAPVHYVSHLNELPRDTRYFVIRSTRQAEGLAAGHWPPRARPIARVRDYSKREMVLFKVALANDH
jgi:hypothetical protein